MADFSKYSLDSLKNNSKFDFLKQSFSNNTDSDAFDFVCTDDMDSPYNHAKFSCQFLDEIEFCKKYKDNTRLSIMSLNIQSISAKINELREFLLNCTNMKCQPDIICIQETWTIHDASFLIIDGYQPFEYTCRKKSQGGGVGMYFKTGIKYKILKNVIFDEKVFESILAEVTFNKNKQITIGSIYRPNSVHPSLSVKEQNSQALEYLNNLIEKHSADGSELILAGDLNIDILKYNLCQNATAYIDPLFVGGFLQLITKPTRCTASSATCLDHII